jgi:hypothetical protein
VELKPLLVLQRVEDLLTRVVGQLEMLASEFCQEKYPLLDPDFSKE